MSLSLSLGFKLIHLGKLRLRCLGMLLDPEIFGPGIFGECMNFVREEFFGVHLCSYLFGRFGSHVTRFLLRACMARGRGSLLSILIRRPLQIRGYHQIHQIHQMDMDYCPAAEKTQ